jgi:hypothetical protein
VSYHKPFSVLAVDASQFEDSIAVFGPMTSLQSASLRQCIELQRVLDGALGKGAEYPDSIAISFPNGGIMSGPTQEIMGELDAAVAARASSNARLDFTGDGVIDDDDSAVFEFLAQAGLAHELDISRLDVNGDLSVDTDDNCEIVMNRGKIVSP